MLKRNLALLIVSLATLAHASDESLVTVLQPLEASGAGKIVTPVAYIGYTLDRDRDDPARELMLTVHPNLVWCDGKPQDRNSAVAAGIKFRSKVPTTDTGG